MPIRYLLLLGLALLGSSISAFANEGFLGFFSRGRKEAKMEPVTACPFVDITSESQSCTSWFNSNCEQVLSGVSGGTLNFPDTPVHQYNNPYDWNHPPLEFKLSKEHFKLLPTEFKHILKSEHFLHRIEHGQDEQTSWTQWQSALENAAKARQKSNKRKGLPDLDYNSSYWQIRHEVENVLWIKSKVYTPVEVEFKDAKVLFQAWIDDNPNLSDDRKKAWKAKVNSVQFINPSDARAVSQGLCKRSADRNAFFVSNLNGIIVCPGYLANPTLLKGIFFHELGHAVSAGLDFDSLMTNDLIPKLTLLSDKSCFHTKQPDPCTLLDDIRNSLNQKIDTHPANSGLKKMWSCLDKDPKDSEITEQELYKLVSDNVDSYEKSYRESGILTSLFAPIIPGYKNSNYKSSTDDEARVKAVDNPFHLNPCKVMKEKLGISNPRSYPWLPSRTLPLYFSTILECRLRAGDSPSAQDQKAILEESVNEAVALTKRTEFLAALFESGKSYYLTGVKKGFNAEEKVADLIGTEVYAHHLDKSKSTLKTKRSMFFADHATVLCRPLDESYFFPVASAFKKEKSDEPHSEPGARLQEHLTPEIKSLLKCEDIEIRPTCVVKEDDLIPPEDDTSKNLLKSPMNP